MKDYATQWSSATPGYLIFLIDQSGSMQCDFQNNKNRAEATAEAINSIIQELILTNSSGYKIKDRTFISLIGYGGQGGNSVDEIRSDYLSAFNDSPLGYNSDEEPYFLEPTAKGLTPMADAFAVAKRLIEEWIAKKPQNPAPIIINISDGQPYTGGILDNTRDDKAEAIDIAHQIMNIHTNDGAPLIFNVYIGDGKLIPIEFAEYEKELQGDEQAIFLFKISSVLPDIFQQIGKNKYGFSIRSLSRAFIYKADPDNLVKFIEFGSTSR